MNETMITARAMRALSELLDDGDLPLNDDDFPDFVEMTNPGINEDDRIAITRCMTALCDHLNISY